MAALPRARAPLSLSGLDDRDIDEIVARSTRWVDDLRGARVLVTGATGWFGTWLLDALVAIDRAHALGLGIVALSRDPDRFASRHPALAAARSIEWRRGDVRDVRMSIDGSLTHVIHAAAESSTTLSSDSEATMSATIVDGTRNVLALAAKAEARRVLFVSSGAVYGPQPVDVDRLHEEHPCLGTSAYAIGKRHAEQLVIDASNERCGTVVARCFAFVGPHMPFDAHFAIGNFVRDAIEGQAIRIEGDGKPRRSYLYMSDLVVWLLDLLVRGAVGGIYNVGSPEAVTIAALAERCAAIAPRPLPLAIAGRSGGHDYIPDVSRIEDELGLRVIVSLDEAIARTARWRSRIDANARLPGSIDPR